MIAALLWVLAVRPQAEDLLSLEERVRLLRSQDLHDAAREVVKKFASEHPLLAGDSRFQRLETTTNDIAAEAERLFQAKLSEARTHFDGGRYPKADETLGRALRIYPERRAQVAEFQGRVREQVARERMVKVPRQPAWVGSDAHTDEKAPRKVTLKSFLIDKYPVTNEEYAAYVAATGAAPNYFSKGRERHPVVQVTWDQASAYAAWAGKRLPTAEEWEAAARGDDRREFPWGNSFQEKDDQFNCNSLEFWQVNKTRAPGTTAVDEFTTRSACGAWMGGNVWEWTSTVAPGKIGDRPAEFRILKGGSFMTPARLIRCASVLPENPALAGPDVGFRCAKDAP